MHSEFACEFIVWSNHDHSTQEITFCSAYDSFCLHHRIKNCSTLEIGVQCIQNLHVNSQYSQIMTTLPQKLLFVVHRNIIRYFHFGPMEKPMKQITAIFVDHDVLYKISILHTALYTVCLYSPSLFFTIRIIGNGNNQLFKISMSPYTRSDTMKPKQFWIQMIREFPHNIGPNDIFFLRPDVVKSLPCWLLTNHFH